MHFIFDTIMPSANKLAVWVNVFDGIRQKRIITRLFDAIKIDEELSSDSSTN